MRHSHGYGHGHGHHAHGGGRPHHGGPRHGGRPGPRRPGRLLGPPVGGGSLGSIVDGTSNTLLFG